VIDTRGGRGDWISRWILDAFLAKSLDGCSRLNYCLIYYCLINNVTNNVDVEVRDFVVFVAGETDARKAF
jgi:hypothetical protein